jgi:AcrR family transcriptional regulator
VAAKEKVPVAWLEAALEAWAEGGLAAVAVEPLARRLGLSKGPFYWRFRSRRDLVLAALAHWEQRETEAVIAGLAAVGDPRERLVRLFRAVTRTRGRRRLELAIVACAHDPLVRPFLARVTRRRLRYLEDGYRALGLAPRAARHRALLAHSAYQGFLHVTELGVSAIRGRAGFEAYLRHVMDTLIPPPDGDD